MPKTAIHDIVFKNATSKDLYDLYMNSKRHSIATGAPAKISAKEREKFSPHDGWITRENVKLIKNQLTVQTCDPKSGAGKMQILFLAFFLNQSEVML
jgi:hypothetical protein